MRTVSSSAPKIKPEVQPDLPLALSPSSLHSIKNSIIEQRGGVPLDPWDFMRELYGDEPTEPLPYVLQDDATYKTARSWETILQIGAFRRDVFVPPCLFFRGRLSGQTVKQYQAFVIDLDNLAPAELGYVLARINDGQLLRPTWIINSGGGIHLYYLLAEPLQAYRRRQSTIIEIKRALTRQVKQIERGEVVMLSPTQPHRLPGSLTKKGERVAAFRIGKSIPIEALAAAVGVKIPDSYTSDPPPAAPKTKENGRLLYLPRRHPAFFESCRRRLWQDRRGAAGRQNALFALAIVGYKCGLTREETLKETLALAELFNGLRFEHGLPQLNIEKECKKWMGGYSQRYIRCSAKRLAEFFGWEWDAVPIKRNGRKQSTHLARLAGAKTAEVKLKVAEYRAANPEASQRKCAKEMSVSFSTLKKYWNDAG